MFLYQLYRYSKISKFIRLPKNFNIYNVVGSDTKQIKIYDKFIKKIDNKIIYSNKSKSCFEIYLKELEAIKQYLDIEELEVQRYKKKSIALVISKIPKFLKFDKEKLQENKIYIGIDKELQDFYLNIDDMTHLIAVAESGAGKSVFVQSLLLSLFYNHREVEHYYLVDAKQTEFGRYRKLNKVTYVDKEEDILNTFRTLQTIMYERYSTMKRDNLEDGNTIYQGKYIFMVMDEFGTLGTISDTKIKKEIEKILIDLAQKSRASKIRLIFIGQKATTENISSNVLANLQSRAIMKTLDSDNIQKMSGNKDELDELGVNPKTFCRGRMFFKDGNTGENKLVQVPFYNLEDTEHIEVLKDVVSDLLPTEEE